MKCITLLAGMAAGAVVTGTLITTMYPDVSRRFMRDARHAWRCSKHAITKVAHSMT